MSNIEKITELEKQLAGIQAELSDLKAKEIQDEGFSRILEYAVLYCAKNQIADAGVLKYTVAALPHLREETLKRLRGYVIEHGIRNSAQSEDDMNFSLWSDFFGEFQSEFLRRGLM